MAGQQSQDITRQVVDRFKARAKQYAQGIAQRLGTPAGSTKLSNDELVRLWNFTPSQDPAGDFARLTAQGMPARQALDQIHPYRSKLWSAPSPGEMVSKAESIKAMAEAHPSA